MILKDATFLLHEMHCRFPQLDAVRANELSNTIYFRSPGARIVNKYSLATMHLQSDDRVEEYAHVVVMPHATRDVLCEFLADLEKG